MRCSRIEELLATYVDGSLGEVEARVVEGHLERCPACRQATDEVRVAQEALRTLPPLRAPASFAPRVRTAVRAQAARTCAQPWLGMEWRTLLPSTALALIAVGTLSWYWISPQNEYIAPASVARSHRAAPPAQSPVAMVAERRAVMAPGPVAPRVALRRMRRGRRQEMSLARQVKPMRDLTTLVAMTPGPAALAGAPAAKAAAPVVALTRSTEPPTSATEVRLPEPAGATDARTEYVAALASPEARLGSAKVASDTAAAPVALALTASTGSVSLRSLTTEASLDWPSM